jgi:hypothetical protein
VDEVSLLSVTDSNEARTLYHQLHLRSWGLDVDEEHHVCVSTLCWKAVTLILNLVFEILALKTALVKMNRNVLFTFVFAKYLC